MWQLLPTNLDCITEDKQGTFVPRPGSWQGWVSRPMSRLCQMSPASSYCQLSYSLPPTQRCFYCFVDLIIPFHIPRISKRRNIQDYYILFYTQYREQSNKAFSSQWSVNYVVTGLMDHACVCWALVRDVKRTLAVSNCFLGCRFFRETGVVSM